VTEEEVISMNRRLGGDASLNAPIALGRRAEWQDWLVDDTPGQAERMAESDELDHPRRRDARSTSASAHHHRAPPERARAPHPRARAIEVRAREGRCAVTLEELSRPVEYGVSRERIRQIEVRAFEKLQEPSALRAPRGERDSWHGRRERNTVNSSRPSRSRDSV
jgi:RNA polymerase sigma-32 factor